METGIPIWQFLYRPLPFHPTGLVLRFFWATGWEIFMWAALIPCQPQGHLLPRISDKPAGLTWPRDLRSYRGTAMEHLARPNHSGNILRPTTRPPFWRCIPLAASLWSRPAPLPP